MFALQHWLCSMTTRVLVCRLFASYYRRACTPRCPKQWSPSLWNQALVQITTGFGQAQSCSYLEVAVVAPRGLTLAPRAFGECSPLQKSMPLLPCLSLLRAWPWVPEQLPPCGLGKWESHSGERWRMNLWCTSCLARIAWECVVMWQSSSPFHCFREDFREVAWERAVSTGQLAPCQLTNCFAPGKITSVSLKTKTYLKYHQITADHDFF